jgi:hypothetical protein
MGVLEGQSLDEWRVVERLLPEHWQDQASACGALRRSREIRDPSMLLRVLLIHLADGCSLAETAARAAELGWCRISTVAVLKRLRASGTWLNWIAQRLWSDRGRRLPALCRRVRAVDGTTVVEGGRTGSRWRMHYAINLADLNCDHFEITDHTVSESLARVAVRKGDLLLGDRGFARAADIASVKRRGGEVLIRVGIHQPTLNAASQSRFKPLPRLRRLRHGEVGDWPTSVVTSTGRIIQGRMIAVKRSARSALRARRQSRRLAQRQSKVIRPSTIEAAGYFMLWTTLSADEMSGREALATYRLRWQIELAFKRAKSILGLGQLPKHNDESAKAWLHGKMVVALLIERLIDEADAFSPWGYPIDVSPQPLA